MKENKGKINYTSQTLVKEGYSQLIIFLLGFRLPVFFLLGDERALTYQCTSSCDNNNQYASLFLLVYSLQDTPKPLGHVHAW